MKNIYKITKGQLITIWIFGVIGFLVSVDQADYSSFATFLSILIPALLIFYTIGWRAFNKIKEENILIVTHGGFVAMLFCVISLGENLEFDQYKKLRSILHISNTGITIFSYLDNKWKLLTWNDTNHL